MKRLMFRQPGIMDGGNNTQGGPYGGFFRDFNPLTPMDQRKEVIDKAREGIRTAAGAEKGRGSIMNSTLHT
jgi:hypothetical protein